MPKRAGKSDARRRTSCESAPDPRLGAAFTSEISFDYESYFCDVIPRTRTYCDDETRILGDLCALCKRMSHFPARGDSNVGR